MPPLPVPALRCPFAHASTASILMHARMTVTAPSGLYTLGASFLAFYNRAPLRGSDRPATTADAGAAATDPAVALPPIAAQLHANHPLDSITMDQRQVAVNSGSAAAQISSVAMVSDTQPQPSSDDSATQLNAVTPSPSSGAALPFPSHPIPKSALTDSVHQANGALGGSHSEAAPPLSEATGAAAHLTAAASSGSASNTTQPPSTQFASSQVSRMLLVRWQSQAHG